MLSYILRRLVLALFTIWAISVLSFIIIQLPPIDFIDSYITERMSAGGMQASPEQMQALRVQYGADQPKPIHPVIQSFAPPGEGRRCGRDKQHKEDREQIVTIAKEQLTDIDSGRTKFLRRHYSLD